MTVTQKTDGEEITKYSFASNRTVLLRHFLPAFLSMAVFVGAGFAWDQASLAILAWSLFYIGYSIGSIFAYKNGMHDEKEIIEMVYGEEWDRNAVLGKMLRAYGEPISQQRYKEVREIAEEIENTKGSSS